MTFALPHILWLLLVPAVLIVADRARRLAVEAQSWPSIRRLWAGPGGLAPSERGVRLPRRYGLWLGLALLIVALARPQWGKIEERVFDQSREVLIALDLSRSMLSADVKPTRLERARLLVESLLDRLKGERVGLLVFSGTAFLQCPLSPDYEVLREFLPALNPDYLPEGGTDYARLLKAALEAFSNEAGADRYLIVLSDGEALTEDWRSQLETLKQRGIRVIALGIGTETGSMIPGKEGGFVKDERGAVVMSKLNPTTLKQLASATGGAYAEASGWLDLPALLQQTIERGQRGALSERKTIRLGERFQWFLAPALLFLLWSYWREFPVSPKPRDLRRHGAQTLMLLGLFLCAAPRELSAANLAQPATGQTPQIQLSPTQQPPPSELPKVVEQLAAQPALSAADCEKLARETIAHSQGVRQSGQPVKPGIVQDGLAAVDRGEVLDAKAADWPELRSQLQALLQPPPQQDQKKDEQKQEEQKKEQQKQDQQQNQEQKDEQKPQDQKQEQQQQQEQKSEEQKQQEQRQQAQQPKPEPPQDKGTQQVGGEKPKDDEAGKNPELAVPLQKLEQVRDKDSPAELFELLHDNEPHSADRPKKDW